MGRFHSWLPRAPGRVASLSLLPHTLSIRTEFTPLISIYLLTFSRYQREPEPQRIYTAFGQAAGEKQQKWRQHPGTVRWYAGTLCNGTTAATQPK